MLFHVDNAHTIWLRSARCEVSGKSHIDFLCLQKQKPQRVHPIFFLKCRSTSVMSGTHQCLLSTNLNIEQMLYVSVRQLWNGHLAVNLSGFLVQKLKLNTSQVCRKLIWRGNKIRWHWELALQFLPSLKEQSACAIAWQPEWPFCVHNSVGYLWNKEQVLLAIAEHKCLLHVHPMPTHGSV